MSDFLSDDPEDIVHAEMNRLRGRLCGLIESWNLPEKQERGAIQTVKSLSYDSEAIIAGLVQSLAG